MKIFICFNMAARRGESLEVEKTGQEEGNVRRGKVGKGREEKFFTDSRGFFHFVEGRGRRKQSKKEERK